MSTNKQPFEQKLWSKVQELLEIGAEEEALYLLYSTLHNEFNKKENYENCNNFLKHLPRVNLNTDVIVHVHNSMSHKKEKLSYWDEFIKIARSNIEKHCSAYDAEMLIKALSL